MEDVIYEDISQSVKDLMGKSSHTTEELREMINEVLKDEGE